VRLQAAARAALQRLTIRIDILTWNRDGSMPTWRTHAMAAAITSVGAAMTIADISVSSHPAAAD